MDRKCFKCAKHFDATLFTDRLPHQVVICLDCQIKMGLRSKADSSSAIQNTYESRIKLLEDNAFSDRAKIEKLENELKNYKDHINEELMVAMAPFKYYTNEFQSLSYKINELQKEVFPEIYGDD